MAPRLYDELVDWYPLIDPLEDHAEEAEAFQAMFAAAGVPDGELLELGAGAGNNAFYLGQAFRLTLSDLSPAMLARSQARNPGAPHPLGDMRTLRLGRTFDAVLLHDAVCYLLTEADVRAALTTVFLHLRPGGVAIVAPDAVADTFYEGTELHEADDGARSLRCLAWSWDPDPTDHRCVVDYVFVLRDGVEVSVVHDRHDEGLFSIEAWERLFAEVGFTVTRVTHDLADDDMPGYAGFVFVATRPS
jgi:SAM-dependent methyltransferase